MANEFDPSEVVREPGLGAAMLTVLVMLLTVAVLSGLVWLLMLGVSATTAGRHEQTAPPASSAPVIDQKALPAKQP